jgi:hypothetical protein
MPVKHKCVLQRIITMNTPEKRKDFFVYLVKIYILRFVDCVLTVLTARVIALTTINFGVFWLKKKFLCSPKLTPSLSQADHCIILTLLSEHTVNKSKNIYFY